MSAYASFPLSSYLAFRYIAKPDIAWKPGVMPEFPNEEEQGQHGVCAAEDTLAKLKALVAEQLEQYPNTGILLSGGIDSAILGALLPRGTKAYTIRFMAEGAIDESKMATRYAEASGLDLTVVEVTWEDYLQHADDLMTAKSSPLHAIEVALYKASKQAHDDGVDMLIVGNGADSTFGGMDKLLSKDWTFDDFVKRYNFIEPVDVLADPVDILEIYEPYRKDGKSINVIQFLKKVHGLGIIQVFENAIHLGGCAIAAPYEELYLDAPLDLERVRNGESKYILRQIFRELYPNLEPPEKIPFARPMDQWLSDWSGPQRAEFRSDLNLSAFTGDQKWLIYCLERFLNLMETA
jgi:hypothetical protein